MTLKFERHWLSKSGTQCITRFYRMWDSTSRVRWKQTIKRPSICLSLNLYLGVFFEQVENFRENRESKGSRGGCFPLVSMDQSLIFLHQISREWRVMLFSFFLFHIVHSRMCLSFMVFKWKSFLMPLPWISPKDFVKKP